MSNNKRKRDGFAGEKMIMFPHARFSSLSNNLFPVHITHLGYFPNALLHYRIRRKGCADNILFYCTKGKGYYKIGDNTKTVSANQFIILPATTLPVSYWADKDNPWSIYWVHFTGNNLAAYNHSLQINLHSEPQFISYQKNRIETWELIYRHLQGQPDSEAYIVAHSLLQSFLNSFLFPHLTYGTESISQPKTITETAISFMEKNLHTRLTVTAIARQVNLSNSHFTAVFKEESGMAPINYFIYIKMQRAGFMLKNTHYPIKEIALMLGYEDPYFFSRLFKENMHLSPQKYRKETED